MGYMYHGVPEQMVGHELIPLNSMIESQSDLYNRYREKYKGREEMLERHIPLLDCLWNDVVQFLPLDPREVFQLQVELGLIPDMPSYRFFEIDTAQLDSGATVVYFKTAPGEENVTVKWLKDVTWEDLQTIPKATVDYYKSLQGTGELPFNYQFIPHILYKGSVDISQASVIEL